VAFLGLVSEALEMVQRVVDGGYHCPTLLALDPWLDSLRGEAAFVRAVRQAEAGQARAIGGVRARVGSASWAGNRVDRVDDVGYSLTLSQEDAAS
jgi:hypothetical protein